MEVIVGTERFEGFGPRLYEFFEDLEDHNDREWFAEHRPTYLDDVKAPIEALLAEVEAERGRGKAFRINRDIRFSKDKAPYKTQQGATIDRAGRGMLYLHVSADGLMAGSGAPHLDATQLARYREAVAGDAGEELAAIVAALRKGGFTVGTLGGDGLTEEGDLKRVPKPYDASHPRADLLRFKKLVAARWWDRPSWITSRRALTEVAKAWDRAEPLAGWLDDHVGPPDPSLRRERR